MYFLDTQKQSYSVWKVVMFLSLKVCTYSISLTSIFLSQHIIYCIIFIRFCARITLWSIIKFFVMNSILLSILINSINFDNFCIIWKKKFPASNPYQNLQNQFTTKNSTCKFCWYSLNFKQFLSVNNNIVWVVCCVTCV